MSRMSLLSICITSTKHHTPPWANNPTWEKHAKEQRHIEPMTNRIYQYKIQEHTPFLNLPGSKLGVFRNLDLRFHL